MKFWQLEKLCLENAYTIKRTGYKYIWKKNNVERMGEAATVIEAYKEVKKDIENDQTRQS
jgi:hypothetical protein